MLRVPLRQLLPDRGALCPRRRCGYQVSQPHRGPIRIVTGEVARHPDADLAILYVDAFGDENKDERPQWAFWDCVSNWTLGEEFIAYGFPSEGPAPDATNSPVPRMFVGNYQRFLRYKSPAGFTYVAGEMSIPAPGGLSGGPLFRPGAPTMLTGIATTNLESYSITDSVEEVDESGSVLRVEGRRVINYGLSLILSEVRDWLDECLPRARSA